MNTKMLRSAALLVAFATFTAGCKKNEDETQDNVALGAPIEVAPVPVEQDGVFRYADEIVTTGKATTNALIKVHKGADASSDVVSSLDTGVTVEKKARRDGLVLVSWNATAGQPSIGWAEAASLTDQAAEPVVIPPTPAAVQDAGAADAAAKVTDAGQTDAASAADAAAADKSEPTPAADAGKADDTTPAATTDDAGAGDGGPGLIRLPIQRRMPILKLPGAAEKKP